MTYDTGILRRAAILAAAALLSACGGGGSPAGSVVNFPGGGSSSPPTRLVNVKVTVTIPPVRKSHGKIRSQYVSVNTKSLVIELASVDGHGVTGVNPTTINTDTGARNCSSHGGARVCSATASGSPGDDVFSITTYAETNAAGSLLSMGSVQAKISGDSGLRIANTVPLTLYGVIASMHLAVAPNWANRGTAAKAAVTLLTYDATGAQIVGPSDYATPVSLQVQGDSQNAFRLHAGAKSGSSISIVRPPSNIALEYDGNSEASPVTVAAALDGNGSKNASANFVLRGKTPPPPVGTIYALNLGKKDGPSATITEYSGSVKGNAQPKRTLDLDSKLYARSLAVDSSGNIYVGYFDNSAGFSPSNGKPDVGNEIAIYAPDASGDAAPSAVITADKTTQTTIFPAYLTFDPSGDLVTYGATSVDGNGGNDAVLIYSARSSGAIAPANAWAFSAPTLFYSGPTGLALDASGNFYVNGALHTSLGPSYGLFVAPAVDEGDSSVTPTRTIPWNSASKLTPGQTTNVGLGSGGEIFIGKSAVTFAGSNPTCQGTVNVYSAGAAGGSSGVKPLHELTLGTIATKNAACNSPRNILTSFFPSLTLYGTTLFVSDDFNNTIDAYKSSAHGTLQPMLQIAGSATGLNAPVALVITSSTE